MALLRHHLLGTLDRRHHPEMEDRLEKLELLEKLEKLDLLDLRLLDLMCHPDPSNLRRREGRHHLIIEVRQMPES
jgi:hypothetical protein